MRAMIAMARICRKAGLLGLFVWLAVAGVSSSMAEPSLLEQLQKGGPSPPPQKSTLPPVRLQIEVATASLGFDQRTNEPVVTFRMTPTSAKLFAEFTTKNVGRPMAIIVDGRVISRPVIREPIIGGSGQISGNMTVADAKMLAERLASGKARLEFEAQD